MSVVYQRVAANNPIVPIFLLNSAVTTGAGLADIVHDTTSLLVGVKREMDAAFTLYHAAADIDEVTTKGTYEAPSAADHCRFTPQDNTNIPGAYEIHFNQVWFGAADASKFVQYFVTVPGGAPVVGICPLVAYDPQNATLGMDLDLDIVCRGTLSAGGSVTAFTLGTVTSGALTNVQVGDYLKPVGIPAQKITAFNSGTGVGTTTAFISDPSSLAVRVFGSAPAAATEDFTTTQKTSLDTIGDTVATNYDAATGTEIAAIAATLANPAGFKKNTAVTDFSFPMRDQSGNLVAGLTVTGTIQKDGGSFAAITSAIAEVGTTGIYQLTAASALLAAEMNADQIVLLFTATGAKPTVVQIYTEP